jgi:hypothetical protein
MMNMTELEPTTLVFAFPYFFVAVSVSVPVHPRVLCKSSIKARECISKTRFLAADLGRWSQEPEPGAPENGLLMPSCPTERRLRKAGFGQVRSTQRDSCLIYLLRFCCFPKTSHY